MTRPLKLGLIAAGVLVFLLASAGLARVLSANNAERAAIERLMTAQARGDAAGMRRLIEGCRPGTACAATQRVNAARQRRPGEVKLAQLVPSSRIVLGGTSGVTRVAWTTTATQRTSVQCVGIRRTGNVVSGMGVELTSLSEPIGNTSDCPHQG